MDFSAEQSPTATDKIQLENITSASAMDRHRRTNCAVEPSLNSGKNSSRNKRVVTSPPSGRSETFDQTLQSFRDTDAAKRFFKRRMKLLSSAACIMGLLSACLALADIELTIMGTDTDEKLSLKNLRAILDNPYRLAAVVVKSTLSIISVLTCVMIYHMYKNDLSYLVVRNIYHESEKFFMTSLFPSCLLEALVCLFHVPPLFDYYGLLYKLQLLVFLRLYLVAKYVKEHNMFVNNQATALFASVTQTDISSMFLVKAYFLKYPVRLISIFYALNVFLGGYVVYVIDRPHTSYLDTVWMLVVTMTTLGFGDVVPKAFLARAFVGLASVLGIFLMALFISVVHETLQLKQQEKRILAIMENAEHLSGKKNLAASCIQSSWRLYHFRITNEDALMRGDWFKYQKHVIIHHRMAEYLRHWRIARRSWSRDDYWKKFFLADDIAMLLTDVSRSVGNVELFLEKQNSGRRSSSRSSLRRGSVTSPPPILEEETASLLPGSPPKDKTRKMHAKLVESWSTSNQEQTPRPSIPKSPVLPPTRPSSGHLLQLTYNHLDKSKPGQMNHFQYDKFNRLGDEGCNGVAPGPRKDEPTDRGGIPVDALHGKVESLEKALDHIYFKMKTELRDVRDSLKQINRRPMSAMASPGLGAKTTGVDFYSYSRTTDQINV